MRICNILVQIKPNDKFQAVILNSKSKLKVNLNICNENVNITDTVKLLGTKIEKTLVPESCSFV